MKKKVLLAVMAAIFCFGTAACGAEEPSDIGTEAVSQKDDEKETGTYQSRLIFLGEYKNLPYTDNSDREPTEEEVEEEMLAILSWFEGAELTAESVKEHLGFASVEEFREDTRKNLKEVYALRGRDAASKELFERVIEGSTFEMAESDIKLESDDYINYHKSQAEMENLSYPAYLDRVMGVSVSEFESSVKKSAETVVKVTLAVDAILEKEKIDAAAQYEEEAQKIAEEEGFESIEDMETQMGGKSVAEEEVAYRLAAACLIGYGKARD